MIHKLEINYMQVVLMISVELGNYTCIGEQ
jgi:hypothetical protein